MRSVRYLSAGMGVLASLVVPLRAVPELSNRVPDASFEAPTHSWFSEDGKGSYFTGKEQVPDAADGSSVLVIQGWDRGGSRILSPPFSLVGGSYSATAQARSFGNVPGANLELALFDEAGTEKLAVFGAATVDGKGQWVRLVGSADLPSGRSARLGLVVSGSQVGARVEVDSVGLFAGRTPGAVADNADFTWFEAEALADGKSWKVESHYTGWYADLPSGMKMLAGPEAVPAAENRAVSRTLTVKHPGPHRLWLRFMRTDPTMSGKFTVALEQEGRVVASREIDNGDPRYGPGFSWAWTSLEAPLTAGAARLVLTRPATEVSRTARKIDLFALTNLADYQPRIQDFRPQAYMRFTNRSEGQEPYCLWMSVHRMQGPDHFLNPGMLSAAGFSGGPATPDDRTKWLRAGQSSPWVRVSDYLLPGNLTVPLGARNNVQLIATRATPGEGLVTGRVRGLLEFAVGGRRRVVKRVEVDQGAPRLLMTLPHDLENRSDEILTALEHLRRGQEAVERLGPPPGPRARHLDLTAWLQLERGRDDPRLLAGEIALLRRLGFNGTYRSVAGPKEAAAFYAQHGLKPRFGLWAGAYYLVKDGCMNQPDREKLHALFKSQAEYAAPMMGNVTRVELADEPIGPPYAHFVSCDVCKGKFRTGLKAQGLTPRELGVTAWSEVVPVVPAEKEKRPVLFYHTGLFRLHTFADLLRTCAAIKRQYLPAQARTTVNTAVPLAWNHHAADPFLVHRNGGLEMGWSEDWLGGLASPQDMSTVYAQLRSAGAPEREPLGGYMVSIEGEPRLLRIKHYTLLAAGARHADVYRYGPAYLGVDSWSPRYEIYPVLSAVQHEFGRIDSALQGTTRRETDIAILYNRTAGIWAASTSATEQDSRYIHWALAHAGYDADFIPEEDVEAGKLARYKLLCLSGPQIRRAAAEKIAAWVRQGGVLFGSAGAGSRDEYDGPLPTLVPVFGAETRDLKLEQDAGRPQYELRTLPVLDVLAPIPGSGPPPASFNQLCYREALVPAAGAKVILKNRAGQPAGVLHPWGRGRAIRVAALPGITYLNEAVRGKAYDPETHLPQAYRPALRDFIAWPARLGGAARVAETNGPITEVTRYDGEGRTLLFVIDHRAAPAPGFALKLPRSTGFRKAYTARGKPVRLKSLTNGVLEVRFPLDITDVVVLER